MRKMLRKVAFVGVLVCGFSGVVSAYCDSKGGCHSGYFGLGGSYANFGGSSDNLKSGGGYAYLAYESVWFNRFLGNIDATLGGGVRDISGATLQRYKNRSAYLNLESNFKVGVNIFIDNAPIFINAILFRVEKMMSSGIYRTLYQMGVEAQARMPLGNETQLLLGGGWTYIFNDDTAYSFSNGNGLQHAKIDGFNYGIHANIGLSSKVGNHLDFYIMAKGRYYVINPSANVDINGAMVGFPAAKSFNVMLELGIRGF